MDASLKVVSIPVADQDRAKDFYVNSLGFQLEFDQVFGEGMRWVQVAPPGGSASVTFVTWFPSMPPGSSQGMVLYCSGLEKAMAAYSAAGVEFNGAIQTEDYGTFVEFADPDGNGWILMQDPEAA